MKPQKLSPFEKKMVEKLEVCPYTLNAVSHGKFSLKTCGYVDVIASDNGSIYFKSYACLLMSWPGMAGA